MSAARIATMACGAWLALWWAVAPPTAMAQLSSCASITATAERYLAAGDRVSAAAYFRDALAADHGCASAYVGLASIEQARGSLGDARHTYEVALVRVAESIDVWLGYLDVLDALGDTPRVAIVEREIETRFANEPAAHRALARRAEQQGRWSSALAHVRALRRAATGDERAAWIQRERALTTLAGIDPIARGGDAMARALRAR